MNDYLFTNYFIHFDLSGRLLCHCVSVSFHVSHDRADEITIPVRLDAMHMRPFEISLCHLFETHTKGVWFYVYIIHLIMLHKRVVLIV